jgi:hypothetical protein
MIIPNPTIKPVAAPPDPGVAPRHNPMTDKVLAQCPECGAPLRKASGCLTCLACGWGKCG